MNIDIHAHIIVPEITQLTESLGEWKLKVFWEKGIQFIWFGDRQIDAARREFVAIEAILAEQDKAGVDFLLLSPWASLLGYDLDLQAARRVNAVQNDALAAIVADYGPRVAAVGTVPLQDAQSAVAELERAMSVLGLKGVEIGTNVNGVYLGDPQFEPFWDAAEALGALVQIHPVPGVGGPTNREYYLWNAFGNPADTALTAAHIILSGVLERHPNLKICLFHGGGHLPYQLGRLDRAYEVRPEARPQIRASPSTYFKKFYFDTITHSPQALAFLIDLVGPRQVMLGSDYPFDMGYERPTQIVEQLADLDAADYAAILGGNARRLLGLDLSDHLDQGA